MKTGFYDCLAAVRLIESLSNSSRTEGSHKARVNSPPVDDFKERNRRSRLETRTKECNSYASGRDNKPYRVAKAFGMNPRGDLRGQYRPALIFNRGD